MSYPITYNAHILTANPTNYPSKNYRHVLKHVCVFWSSIQNKDQQTVLQINLKENFTFSHIQSISVVSPIVPHIGGMQVKGNGKKTVRHILQGKKTKTKPKTTAFHKY